MILGPETNLSDEVNHMTQPKKARRGRLKRALASAAPSLAHALGGPLAGAAVSQLSRAVFGAPGADEDALLDAVTSGEHRVALRKADLEFQKAVLGARIESQRIAAADRANARARQIATDDWTASALGALILLGFFIVLGAMVTQRLPEGAETEFSIMLGALATMTAAVVNYFFGSSAGSKEKTRMLNDPREEI